MILTFPTAYIYWMCYTTIDLHESFKQPNLENLQSPLHILVSEERLRRKESGLVCHVIPNNLPKSCIKKMTTGLSVISPEACFLLAAKSMSVPELVVMANHLCGIFCLNPFDSSDLRKREPITSVSRIKAFLHTIQNVAGIKKARVALQYAADRSASPVESKLAAIGVLPLSRGGYALPKPALNANVKHSAEGEKILKRKISCCDMVWEEQRVVVEYDSDQFHMDQDQFYYDKGKSSALIVTGYKVIHITRNNLRNHQSIESQFLAIRKILGMRHFGDRLLKYKRVRFDTIQRIFFTPFVIGDFRL